MDLSLQAITLRPEPSAVKGFFRLPWELRQRIYELSLIELPRWEKLHNPDCILIATDLHSAATARRHSLDVLLANRQVYREAAPVLWSRNVFCFHRIEHFTEGVGKNLRTAHRLMLRHVSILLYTNDSVSNRNHMNHNQTNLNAMWDTILQCNGLRTLEVSHTACGNQLDHFTRMRKQLPQLQSFRMTTLMAYRVWPRRDQSQPEGRRPWTLDQESTTNPPATTAPPEPAFIPFGGITPTPSPPPPAEHYLVLNPNLAGFDYCCHRDLSRTLWFKTGVEIDLDTLCASLATGPDAYTDLVRNYRTNFLVHLRFELARLPETWAREYPPARPYRPLPRRDMDQVVSSDSDSDSRSSSWDPMHGACHHNPEAIRLVVERIPEHMRDEPATQTLTLRDGRSLSVQIMGLPITKALRIERYQARQRMIAQKHAAGELTAREAAFDKIIKARRADKMYTIQQKKTRDASREMADRQARNTNREEARKTEERESRAEAQARAAERREEVLALRQAARKRFSDPTGDGKGASSPQGEDGDGDSSSSGSEADTEEDNRTSRRQKLKSKLAASKARGGAKAKGSKNKKQGRAVGEKASRHPARAEIVRRMRTGNYSD
ncbi:hypothetical protein Sste5346_002236 [Sporothrix stenoceras]|uniref:DUF7730 domain-containing protein n=1 Tax=Sporothrix stenoceras TaxID=5173 RepID=A0ABR3ZJD0_9PEZI